MGEQNKGEMLKRCQVGPGQDLKKWEMVDLLKKKLVLTWCLNSYLEAVLEANHNTTSVWSNETKEFRQFPVIYS